MKDSLRVRMLNHLENYLAQRELAINAAVVASAQMGLPKPTLFLTCARKRVCMEMRLSLRHPRLCVIWE